MFHYNEPVQDRQGNGLVGYFIGLVTLDPANLQGGSPATIYADANGTPILSVSGVANLAKVDENGMVSLYVAEGSYHIDLYGPDGTTILNRYYNIPMLSAAINTTSPASVGSRALVAAITSPASTQSVYLSEAGREGTFTFSTANLSSQVTADPQQGIYVAPSTDVTGASGAWVRKFSGPADIRWWGAVADCTAAGTGTDNTPIFNAARAALIASGRGWLHIPKQAKAYRFATAPAQIHDQIKITGDGWSENPGIVGGTNYSGVAVYNGSILCFDADVAGFQFVAYTDNAANATAYEFQSAVGSSVRDIMLYSAGGTGTTSHGIERRTVVHLENVRIEGFAGYGLKTFGYSSGTNPYGSVDITHCRSVSCRYNKLSGFYTEGDDVNVNHFDTCDAALNGGVGYLDKGELGNNYTSCHAATNNQSFGTPAGYSAAQRTQNTTDWSGLSDQQAGSYVTTSGVGAHTFGGCYAETGIGHKHEIIYPSVVTGGNLASTEMTATATANPPRIDNTSKISGVDTIDCTGRGNLTLVTPVVIASPASGNAIFKASGPGAYAELQLYPAGSSANGLDILAGAATATFSADSFTLRNAAQNVNFGTFNSAGFTVPAGSIGYATGAGGAVTQATSRATGVTLNKACGQITLFSAAGSGTWATFTVTNSLVAATDSIRVSQASGTDKYMIHVTGVRSGAFDITFATTGGTTTEAPVFNFAVIKAVAA